MLTRLLPLALLTACSAASAQPAQLQTRIEALAAAGNAEAAYHLGMFHHLGVNGISKNPRKAFQLFEAAAAGGDPLGAYKLGCYYDGQGEGVVADDPALALRYKLVAAEAGYALAQHDVALLFYKRGDAASALRWLKAAADQGDAGSLMAFASVNNGAEGVAKNPVATFAYFTLALRRRGVPSSAEQTAWLAEFESRMSASAVAEAAKIIAAWSPRPTPLTLKALSGDAAAQALVRSAKAPS